MHVGEVLDQTAWERLRPLWNPLLGASSSATTFLTWEWLTCWWSAYGNRDDLFILTASDDDGTIRGIAPLRREMICRYGRTVPALAFLGDGSNDSDYLDFIVARGFEERVMETWLRHTRTHLPTGPILRLNEIPSESPISALSRNWRTAASGPNKRFHARLFFFRRIGTST